MNLADFIVYPTELHRVRRYEHPFRNQEWEAAWAECQKVGHALTVRENKVRNQNGLPIYELYCGRCTWVEGYKEDEIPF